MLDRPEDIEPASPEWCRCRGDDDCDEDVDDLSRMFPSGLEDSALFESSPEDFIALGDCDESPSFPLLFFGKEEGDFEEADGSSNLLLLAAAFEEPFRL